MEDIKKSLGDECKDLENKTKIFLPDNEIMMLRVDGRAFHTYTKGLKKPFDENLTDIMIETMNYLVSNTGATLGYHQSDEITLVFIKDQNSKYMFDAKVQKIASIIASMTTAKFNDLAKEKKLKNDFAFFDCRVWSVPEKTDVIKNLIYRQRDAIKNSVSMASQSIFNEKELNKKNTQEKIDMLNSKNINFFNYNQKFTIGTFCNKILINEKIPENLKRFHTNKETYDRYIINNFNQLFKFENIDLLINDFLVTKNKKNKLNHLA